MYVKVSQIFSFRFRDRLAFNMSQSNTFQHKFTYTAPEAKSVLVTGTFDQWSKTQTLNHVADGVFTGTISIPYQTPGEAIYYKYVVDEQWITDSKTETKNDESGNLNNVIYAPTEPGKNSTSETPAPATAVATGTATGTATTQASAQGQQLPPLFVPPVVLPSDKAAYQEAMAKGDNEVVRPESSNLESFPVVENDVDRTSSPVIVEPPHPQQEPG
ncbi:hypothetical protein NQZ79_g4023 [Umbelopsis isabellina]|nr:hypothetical protein NQZ79_g4023 [Umbelopsis isabellina]